MTRRRVAGLMRRSGVEAGPLDHITDLGEYVAALRGLSDAEVLAEVTRVERARVAGLSDAELLAELQALEAQGHRAGVR